MNQVQDPAEARQVHTRLRAVCRRFLGVEVPLAGWIAQDVRVAEAVRARSLFLLRSPGTEASRNITSVARTVAQQAGSPTDSVESSTRPRRLASVLQRLWRLG
jgi:flagellar biosynthesis protein FlhG